MIRKKTIQVILTKDVEKVGKQGTLIKVKPGYIRNYLIPLKLGKIATVSLIKQFELQQKEAEMRQIQFVEKCIINKELLESLDKFIIKKKISENGVFFGKVTKKQILELIGTKLNLAMELNKTQLELPEMKKVGVYIIEILLTTNIIAKLNIEILPE
uniref:50S ribosomal protein L9 n=1 Tax=Halosiphon tomentosus TaxID=64927 RepID=UPI002E7654A1|nr:50S ribosomal protein L9 [Halosiphon tomentosus]WAM63819.1 50S ribosomal protein L9 [Halosiphon tomentosus]